MKTIYLKKTGEPKEVEMVDAAEILKDGTDEDGKPVKSLYTDIAPGGKAPKASDAPDTFVKGDDVHSVAAGMTVAELRAALDTKGVQYPAGSLKNDLIQLFEVANADGTH